MSMTVTMMMMMMMTMTMMTSTCYWREPGWGRRRRWGKWGTAARSQFSPGNNPSFGSKSLKIEIRYLYREAKQHSPPPSPAEQSRCAMAWNRCWHQAATLLAPLLHLH